MMYKFGLFDKDRLYTNARARACDFDVRNQLVGLVNLVIADLTDINISAHFVFFRHRLCRVVFSQVKHLQSFAECT